MEADGVLLPWLLTSGFLLFLVPHDGDVVYLVGEPASYIIT